MGNVNELQERREDHSDDGDCSTASSNSTTTTSSFSSSSDTSSLLAAFFLDPQDDSRSLTNNEVIVPPVTTVVSVPRSRELVSPEKPEDMQISVDINVDQENQEVVERIADDSFPLSDSGIPISFEIMDDPSPVFSDTTGIFLTPDIPQVDVEVGRSFSQLISSSPVMLGLEYSQAFPGDPESLVGAFWLDEGGLDVASLSQNVQDANASSPVADTAPNDTHLPLLMLTAPNDEFGLILISTNVGQELSEEDSQHNLNIGAQYANSFAQTDLCPMMPILDASISLLHGPEEVNDKYFAALKNNVDPEESSTVEHEPVKRVEGLNDKDAHDEAGSPIPISLGLCSTDDMTLATGFRLCSEILFDARPNTVTRPEQYISTPTSSARKTEESPTDSLTPGILETAKTQSPDEVLDKSQKDNFKPTEQSPKTSIPLSPTPEIAPSFGHTADKPNWALAPIDSTKSSSPSIRKPRKTDRRRGGRRGKHANADTAPEKLSSIANDNGPFVLPLGANDSSHLHKHLPLSSTPTRCETKYDGSEPDIWQTLESKREKYTTQLPHQGVQLGSTNEPSVETSTIISSTSQSVLKQLHRVRGVKSKQPALTEKQPAQEIRICPPEIHDCLEKQERTAEGLHKTDRSTITVAGMRNPASETQLNSPLLSHLVTKMTQNLSPRHASSRTDDDDPLNLPRTPEVSDDGHIVTCTQPSSVGATLKISSSKENFGFATNKSSLPLSLTATGGCHNPLGKTSWPSLDEELRFHANERSLSLGRKDAESSQNISAAYSVKPIASPTESLDRPSSKGDIGGLKPTTKPRHVTFDDSVRVNLPSRKTSYATTSLQQTTTSSLNRPPNFQSNIPVPTRGQRNQPSGATTGLFLNGPFYLGQPSRQVVRSVPKQDPPSIQDIAAAFSGPSRGRSQIQQAVPHPFHLQALQPSEFTSNHCAGPQSDRYNVIVGQPNGRYSFPTRSLRGHSPRTSLNPFQPQDQNNSDGGHASTQRLQQRFQDGSSAGTIHSQRYFGHVANDHALNTIPSWNETEPQVFIPSSQGPRDEPSGYR